jgi:hypothetical protein
LTTDIDTIDHDAITTEQRAAFLAYIADHDGCSTREACETVGIKRKDVKALKAADAEFAGDYREARGYGDDVIRNELARRAIEGVDEPVFWQGQQVGTVRRYSDRLLALMAKAHLDEYGDRIEITGANGQPLQPGEDRSASLNDVARVLEAVGALTGIGGGAPRIALPPAPKVLAEPDDGVGAADSVPGS